MKAWKNVPNDVMALNLELWLDLDAKVQTDAQKDFFDEVIWRLRLMTESEMETEHG